MTETTAERPVPRSPQPSSFPVASGEWWPWTVRAIVIFIIALGCYTLGRHSSAHAIEDYQTRNAQLSSDNGRLASDNKNQALQITNLQDQLKSAQGELNDILRPARNFEIRANESEPVSIGQLIIGLVGTPKNESVDLNINGKQQSVAAGDVVNLELPITCRIQVMSFDVLKSSAAVNTVCAATKP